MTPPEITRHRLHKQHLVGKRLASAADVVRWQGAVQSQDYGGAKWGVGQRTHGLTDADIDREFDEGAFLRTHVMRPTWHFVVPEDIRWLLQLTAPRVHAINAYYYRQTELDDAIFAQSTRLLEATLRDRNFQTRTELARVFREAGIEAEGLRLTSLMMRAEIDGVICSGPRRGKQFTYALLEERVPPARPLDREEALAALTRRYFTSRGPASAQDFAWWSGLTVADAKEGLALVEGEFVCERAEGRELWFAPSEVAEIPPSIVHLLPNYDERFIGYRDHELNFEPEVYARIEPGEGSLMAHIVTFDGLIAGGWRRELSRREAIVELKLLRTIGEDALQAAADAYSRFHGVKVTLRHAAVG